MQKILLAVLLCTACSLYSMEWVTNFGNSSAQNKASLFNQFRRQSTEFFEQSKASAQDLLNTISPKKQEAKSDPDPVLLGKLPIDLEKLEPYIPPPPKDTVDEPILKQEVPNSTYYNIKLIGLSIMSIGMTVMLYKFIQEYGKTPVYRKRPWH